ncbi:MAG: hypothetical protein LBP62_06460 [Clostridiales bacterium]|nr:hypothetical protein [Clostridiales bacterium]
MRRFLSHIIVDVKGKISNGRYAPPLRPSHGGELRTISEMPLKCVALQAPLSLT